MNWLTSGKWETTKNRLKLFVLIVLFFLVLLLSVLILLWPLIFALVWSKFHAIQHFAVVRVLMTLFLVFLAKQLYDIRRMFRHWYGAAEVLVGMLICWIVLRDLHAPRMTVTIALAGAVYLMVRGIDNYIEGCDQRKEILEEPLNK